MAQEELLINYEQLLEKNKQFLWNPFTQMKEYLKSDPLIIEKGLGVKLYDINGKEYYDGYSSLWVNAHGHNNPKLNDAITKQLNKISHSTLLGSANIPAILLAEKLAEITPSSLRKTFYSDSGATAVEIALKMAFQYWKNKGHEKKQKFISMKNAYHGDTIGAVSVGGMEVFHRMFNPLLFEGFNIPYPYTYKYPGSSQECIHYCLSKLENVLLENSNEIAAIIVEPMVQGASGIVTMPSGFLTEIKTLCDNHNILFIADEVATGFGRTGEMFACDHEKIEPDIMTVGKMLTGGYLPVAATITTDEIYNSFYADFSDQKTFYHGHSFTGNQLGCSVALANLALYDDYNTLKKVSENSLLIKKLFEDINTINTVGEVRQLGFMCGIELKASPTENQLGFKICQRAKELGLLTRNLNDVITFIPPLISNKEELTHMISILKQAIEEIS